jgi:nucleoside-diphosphate-sugar epimerase
VLVTGASGFVGRPAVAALAQLGFEVHAASRQPHPGDDATHRHVVDLFDRDAVNGTVHAVAPTHLLHLAWCTEHGSFWDDPANEAWVDATAHLLDAFRTAGGSRVVVAGSCAQYGWDRIALGPDGVAHEHSTPHQPATRYGRAKERVAGMLGDSDAIGLVFFPFGPYEQAERLVPSVTRSILRGTPARITSGRQVRDFLHVDDCGTAFAALVDSEVAGPVNLGSGVPTAIVDVARTIARLLGCEDLLEVGAIPDRTDDPPRLVADVTRLRDEVGFEPRFELESGLRDVIAWWRQEMRRK